MNNMVLQILSSFLHSDFLTKIIMFILVIMSIYCWTIIFEKLFKFKILSIKTSNFEKMFWSGDLLEDIYQKVKNSAKCPYIAVFISGMQEWLASDIQNIMKNNDINKKNSLKERLYDIMTVAANRSMNKLKSGLSFLLVIGTTATLIGLLGTAWGMLISFKSISTMRDATIATIAPGVGTALITTIIGMLTAIPALASYYLVRSKVNSYENELDNFKLEVLTILSREMD